jgi:hypothetical protein
MRAANPRVGNLSSGDLWNFFRSGELYFSPQSQNGVVTKVCRPYPSYRTITTAELAERETSVGALAGIGFEGRGALAFRIRLSAFRCLNRLKHHVQRLKVIRSGWNGFDWLTRQIAVILYGWT